MAKSLVLFPTSLELESCFQLETAGDGQATTIAIHGQPVILAVCGIGAAAAGIVANHWIRRHAPERVALAGIAGTLDPVAAPLGSLVAPHKFYVHGIGTAHDRSVLPLPFPQVPAGVLPRPVHELIELERTAGEENELRGGSLTVMAPAASDDEAERRRREYPAALIETMEDFPIALCARILGLPLKILRGVSNRAGDRNPQHWQVEPALWRCRQALEHWLSS